jgi:hypothetical protein
MAIADGEKPQLQIEQIKTHCVNCANCRLEIEHVSAILGSLDFQTRLRPQENIWPLVERHLNRTPARKAQLGARGLLLLGSLLFAYKIILMIPERDLGLWVRLIPVLLVIIVFTYVKENPFKINAELKLEGETQ